MLFSASSVGLRPLADIQQVCITKIISMKYKYFSYGRSTMPVLASTSLLCALFVLQGCASTNLTKDEKLNVSQSVSVTTMNGQQDTSKSSLPVLRMTQTEINSLVESKWSPTSLERVKESKLEEKMRNRAIRNVTFAGLGPLQCTDGNYEFLQVGSAETIGEVWIVNICGQKKAIVDFSGNVVEVNDIAESKM